MTVSENPPEIPDEALVRAAQGGDTSAFDALVRRHYGTVFAVAYARCGSGEMAEDLAQEVFLRAWLQVGTLRDAARFAPWITLMARNLALDWKRRGESRSRLITLVPVEEHVEHQPMDQAPLPSERAASRQEAELAAKAVNLLPPDLREVVLLHYSEGLGKSEIARRLGVHPSTVGRQLEAAVGMMRESVTAGLRRPAASAPFRPPVAAPARVMGMVAATALLAPEAKAALTAAIAQSTSTTTATTQATAAAGGLAQLLGSFWASISIGASTLATTKGIILSSVAAVSILGGAALYNHGIASILPHFGDGPSPAEIQETQRQIMAEAAIHPDPVAWGDTIKFEVALGAKHYFTCAPNPMNIDAIANWVDPDGKLQQRVFFQGGMANGEAPLTKDTQHAFLTIDDAGTWGVLAVRTDGKKAHFASWFDSDKDIKAAMRPVGMDYLEGRASVRTYRQKLIELFRQKNFGPDDAALRELFYAELMKQLQPPQMPPPEE